MSGTTNGGQGQMQQQPSQDLYWNGFGGGWYDPQAPQQRRVKPMQAWFEQHGSLDGYRPGLGNPNAVGGGGGGGGKF